MGCPAGKIDSVINGVDGQARRPSIADVAENQKFIKAYEKKLLEERMFKITDYKKTDQSKSDWAKTVIYNQETVYQVQLDIVRSLNEMNKLISHNITDIITAEGFNIEGIEGLGQCLNAICIDAVRNLKEKYYAKPPVI